MTCITFDIIDSKTGNSKNYINLAIPSDDIDNMVDGDTIVIHKKTITVCINYPLTNHVYIDIDSDSIKGFTRKEIALKVAEAYQMVYDDEFSSPDIMHCCIPGFLITKTVNDGKYGIQHHGLGDLVLRSIEYNDINDKYHLTVESRVITRFDS